MGRFIVKILFLSAIPGSQSADRGKEVQLCGLNHDLQKRYIEILTPSTSDLGLLLKIGLYIGDQVRIRPLG